MSYTDPTQHTFWLASRSVGIVALLCASLSVGLGVAMSARLARSVPGAPPRLKVLHEAVSLTTLMAIALHGLLLLGDGYLHPGPAGIAVPFVLSYHAFWTGVGVIAGWLSALFGLSFYARRWIGSGRWRTLHRWALVAWVLAIGHSLGAGTDARSAWLLVILATAALPVAVLALVRYSPSRAGPPARGARAPRAPATRPGERFEL